MLATSMAIWKLDDIYTGSADELKTKAESLVKKLEAKKDSLSEDISNEEFLDILKLEEELTDSTSRLGAYASLWQSEDTNDSERNSHYLSMSEFLTDLGNRTLFINIWFKNLSDETAERLIHADEKYSYMLATIRKFRKYTLGEKEEQILNLKDLTGSDALTNMYDIITNKFSWEVNGETLTQEEMTQYYRDFDKEKRRETYEAVLTTYGENEAVLGEIYKNLANDWRNENMKLRGFTSPISVRNVGNDVPDEAIDNLLKAAEKNVDLFKEYFRLKFKVLGIENPSRTDVYAPRDREEKEYSYDEATELVLDTYKKFSNVLGIEAQKMFDAEHVHSEIQEGKRSGAFNYTVQNDIVPYTLINYTNKLRDVFTLMHETGHGIHGLLARKQTKFTFHSTLPLAETASIFGENILYQRLIKESPEKQKVSLLMDQLDGQYGSIGRQSFFVLFEKKAHDMIAEGATIDELNAAYMENLKEQFDGVAEIPEYFQHEWKYVPHIYHTPFYCYAYAFGNLLVLSLMKKYEEEGEAFIPKFIKILEYGGSKAPYDILKEAGFDITSEDFWNGGFDIIREELEELKKLVE
jgi:oligoendopeptidase F